MVNLKTCAWITEDLLSYDGASISLLCWDKDYCDTAMSETKTDWVRVLRLLAWTAIPMSTA